MTLQSENPNTLESGEDGVRITLSSTSGAERLESLVQDSLKSRGYIVSYPRVEIKPGDAIDRKLKDSVRESDAVIMFFGDRTGAWQISELATALAYGKPIVPVVVSQNASIPAVLGNVQPLYITGSGVASAQIDEMVGNIHTLIRKNNAESAKQRLDALRKDRNQVHELLTAEERALAEKSDRITGRIQVALTVTLFVAQTLLLFSATTGLFREGTKSPPNDHHWYEVVVASVTALMLIVLLFLRKWLKREHK